MHISINLIFVEAITTTSLFYFWTYHSKQSHLTLKRAHALFELSFTTSTNEGEVELECPTIFHPCSLQRRNDGCRCSAFEEFGVAIVIGTISKRREFRGYFASLVSRLQIKPEVKTFFQKGHTCRVGVNTIEVNRCVLCWVAQESYTLIGIGEISTRSSGQGCTQKGYRHHDFFHILPFSCLISPTKEQYSLHKSKEYVQIPNVIRIQRIKLLLQVIK